MRKQRCVGFVSVKLSWCNDCPTFRTELKTSLLMALVLDVPTVGSKTDWKESKVISLHGKSETVEFLELF